MKKYFIVSDIHSFATELKRGLRKAGFNKRNKNHILIVVGDVFDRGNETIETYRYLKTIPHKRLILIKGNHESLYFDLLSKPFPEQYDFSNGTVNTFCQIADIDIERLSTSYYFKNNQSIHYRDKIFNTWCKIKQKVAFSEVTSWLCTDEWKNYYELDNYIFTHSFIPVKNEDGLPSYYIRNRKFSYKPDWRTDATELEWEDARWGCPWLLYKDGLFREEAKNGKVLVCGHWHSSDFHEHLGHKKETDYSIFYGDNIIALDACTAMSGIVNVLVIDSEKGIIK